MPVFSYKGFDTRGKAVSGVKDADNLLALLNPVAAMRYWKEREAADRGSVAVLTRQLGTLLRAGVPLADSLGALVDQVEKPGLKRVLADVKTQVNEGSSLGDAMARHGRVFEDLYVN